MTVTVKDFKKWLDRFPDDTEVRVARGTSGIMWESYGPVEFITPDLHPEWSDSEGWSYSPKNERLYIGESS